ncbi:hypothetical protein DPMN_143375 [Dreissena polymorpha]|uniref:Uncharacterized protein n=1 Tax=Dreissena polymorpha TaxID=45954 RepID=A0A9D4GJ15_DREPO|nr:hypothetical protein DPMN_143375 [Dreissena polymorpha]
MCRTATDKYDNKQTEDVLGLLTIVCSGLMNSIMTVDVFILKTYPMDMDWLYASCTSLVIAAINSRNG